MNICINKIKPTEHRDTTATTKIPSIHVKLTGQASLNQRHRQKVEESTHSAGRRSAMETVLLRMRDTEPCHDTQLFIAAHW